MKQRLHLAGLFLFLLLPALSLPGQGKKSLELTDMMRFKQLEAPSISGDGRWVVHTARPDRGEPEVHVYSSDGKQHYTILLGEKPRLSRDGHWVACVEAVSPEVLFNSAEARDPENGPKAGMVLLNTETGEQEVHNQVSSFTFSENSQYLLYHQVQVDSKKKTGTDLHIRSLGDTLLRTLPFVKRYALDSLSRYLAYTVSDTLKSNNGLYLADLEAGEERILSLFRDSLAWVDKLTWNKKSGQLVFLAGVKDAKGKKRDAFLMAWQAGQPTAEVLLSDADLEEGWKLYHSNTLRWSRDGRRLFLGLKPEGEILPEEEEDSIKDFYGCDDILAEREVDVWHWDDPYISTHQKQLWKRKKDQVYMAVYDPGNKKLVQLASPEIPDLRWSESSTRLLLSTNLPHAKEVTWDGRYRDYYLVELQTGVRQMVLERQQHAVSLSPDGRYLSYYRGGNWFLVDARTLEQQDLTSGLGVPFADEDWDYPENPPGYGVAGWTEGSGSVLIYDKFDIWEFPTDGSPAACLTEGQGRKGLYQFRIKKLRRESPWLKSSERVFLSAYHDSLKHTALFSMKVGSPGVKAMVEEERKYTLLAKAREADKLLYTRESYREFPDLWVAKGNFKKPRRLSDVNPQVKDFAWGHASLVEWQSMDGKPLQGILITPENAEPGQKLPVLVYYYRFFTDRLYEFNHVAINHRPCFPFYASKGYAVFLPDIRFDIGNPGHAATKCLVPGVQKLIDMGVADPGAICLHGHSWSGYQTAFVITETDLFTCAIAGAPVSNMTSAYGGIRWESGLNRQFQYEKSQSRIGASLWEARDKYIENSPLFFADRINTPLLIMFGDEDGAVPWYQGIELYMAMRRLEKDCIFLQYRKEGHHPKKYANKLDYTIKFREYLDHYLKGEPAADWIKEGVPYRGH